MFTAQPYNPSNKYQLTYAVVTLLLLLVVYLLGLGPLLYAPFTVSSRAGGIIISIYWWLYGGNFLIYLTMHSRVRDAYRIFFKDIWSIVRGKKNNKIVMDAEMSSSSDY